MTRSAAWRMPWGTRGRALVTVLVATALLSSLCGDVSAADVKHPSRATVLEVQHLFQQLGYPLGNKPLGGLGVRTRGAISYFQRKYGLPATGYPDPRTIAKMQAVARSLRASPGVRESSPHDLVERTLGDHLPILAIAIVLAVVLALLALSARQRPAQDSAAAEDTIPTVSTDDI
jgi:peptidoglycan hydrolase-like protein with peptidoglycan-binding domain